MSTETYEFVEATPVKRTGRQGAGRRPEPNPFEAAVKAIAGQAGVARATRFTLDTENGETIKQRTSRIRRFLTRAGKLSSAEQHNGETDHVSIAMVIDPVEGTDSTYTVRFWDRSAV